MEDFMKHSTHLFKRAAGLALALVSAVMLAALLNYSPDRFAPTVSAFETVPLICGEPKNGEISPRTQTDIFSFGAGDGERVQITVVKIPPSGDNFQPEWRLANKNGDPVSGPCGMFGQRSQSDCGPLASSDSDYQIQIRDFRGDSTGSYRVQFYRLNAAAACDDRPLACGTQSDAAIDELLDNDLFSFNAVANEPVSVTVVKSAQSGANFQTAWRLLRGNGAPVSSACGDFRTIGQPTACGPLPVGDNPYRVQVQDAGNDATGDYSVTVNFRATACPSTTISLSPSPLSIVAGTSANLTVTINPARNAATRITLASGTPAVALAPNEVNIPANATSASFPVRGVSVGGPARVVATLPADLGGGNAQAIINVIAPTISLTGCSQLLTPGTSCTMTATLSHILDSNTTLTLSSSNTSIATVPNTATIAAGQRSVSFQVTGVAAGGATITAMLPAPLGGGRATANITVGPPPFSISLSPNPLTIVAGTSENMRVTINQARNQPTQIALSSSHPGIASVPDSVTIPANITSAQFRVKGESVGGPVTITARLPQQLGGGSATSTVRVVPVTLSLAPCTEPLTPGTSCAMTATISHALDETTQITLSSSNPSIAFTPIRAFIPAGQRSVSFQVNGVAVGGPVTIRATLPQNLGGDSATANITVVPPRFTISLSPDSLNIIAGTSQNMRVTINQARNQQTQIDLASSNSNIASVPNSVTIPANATSVQFRVTGESVGGPVTITAKLPQQLGGDSDNSSVRVLAVTLSLAPCSEPLTPGTSCTMTATISHALDIHTELRLSSSDTGIARVPDTATIPAGHRSVSFEVTGVRTGGPVTIRATLPQKLGGDSATANVTVGPLTATADIEIIPPNPTTNDNISVKISGTFPNTCIPTNPQVSRSGNEITISTSNPGQACAQRATPWSHTVNLGQLAAGNYLIIVTYHAPNVSLELGRKSFTVTPAISRILRVVNTNANPNSSVRVPITLDSQGDENALGFSLSFDTAILSRPQVALGSDATGALLTVNATQVAQGRLGVLIALPAGQRFNAGVRQIAVVSFDVAATSATSTTITPVDLPISCQASGVNANPLPISCVGGVVTISQGLEADVAPRTGGNGAVTIADCVQVGRFVAGLDTPSTGPGGEFQRADNAPRETRGDGRLGVTDWVQACRYAAALDPTQPVGGPTSPLTTITIGPTRNRVSDTSAEARTLRVINTATGGDGSAWLIVTLDAQGAENALGFSLRFDPTVWRFVSASAGGDTAEALINVNADQAALGRLGIAMSLPAGRTLAAGTREIVRAHFVPISRAAENLIAVAFGDQPVAREAADVNANALPIRYAVSARELRAVTVVSAASFEEAPLAAESIATAFGGELSADAQAADDFPLPAELAGTRAIVRDSAGVDRPAPLFFVSPAQINYLVPEGTAAGDATLIVTRRDGVTATGTMRIAPVAPALFTANASGDGVAAALALRIRSDGSQSYEPVAVFDPAQNRFVAVPIELGDDQVFLTLFGSGLRHRSSMAEVKAKIGGVDAEVVFAGAQGGFAGLDQVNLRIPRNLIGRGEVEIVLTVDGQRANPARISIGQ
jgi:uncharacterized protein (TIGR03437 family)